MKASENGGSMQRLQTSQVGLAIPHDRCIFSNYIPILSPHTAHAATGPYATGDGMSQDAKPTNIAPYGSAYVGLLGAVVRRTSIPTIVGTDLLPVDYHHGPAWPTTLYYNPWSFAPVSVGITLPVGAGCDAALCVVYDAVSQGLVGKTMTPGQQFMNVTLAPDVAAVLVVFPAAAPLAFDASHGWLKAGGAVIDWAATGLPPGV
jgi:hypothetical protein